MPCRQRTHAAVKDEFPMPITTDAYNSKQPFVIKNQLVSLLSFVMRCQPRKGGKPLYCNKNLKALDAFLCNAMRSRLASTYQIVWHDMKDLGWSIPCDGVLKPTPCHIFYFYEFLRCHCHHRQVNLGRLSDMELGQVGGR